MRERSISEGLAAEAEAAFGQRGARLTAALALALVGLSSVPSASAASTAVPGFLDAVSCSSATFCMSVGAQGANNSAGLAEEWNGTSWSETSLPLPSGASNIQFFGVSCPTQSFCLTVGSYFAGHGTVALAETWNATAWSIQTVRLPADDFGGGGYGNFDGVSCTTAASCMAVGDYPNASNTNSGLAELWNGVTFTPEAVPVAGAGTTALVAVSCPESSSSCEGIGWYLPASGNETATAFGEIWNGSAWSQQAVPVPVAPGASDYPSGLSCRTISTCVAVGFGFNGASPETAWAMQLSKGAWSLSSAVTPAGASFDSLNAVACAASSTSCEAVGNSSLGVMAQRSNGAAWSIQKPANAVNSSSDTLAGISCAASLTPCAAVGYATSKAGLQFPIARARTGAKWTLQTIPTL